MYATKARALICTALAVAAFTTIIAIQTRQPEPSAWCDLKSMNCYDRLGSVR